jgi:hypothetical protein
LATSEVSSLLSRPTHTNRAHSPSPLETPTAKNSIPTIRLVTSLDIVTAMAFTGDLTFNPVSDTLIGSDGKPPFKFSNPSELPPGTLSLGDTYVTTPGLTRLLSTPALEKRVVGTLFMIMGTQTHLCRFFIVYCMYPPSNYH